MLIFSNIPAKLRHPKAEFIWPLAMYKFLSHNKQQIKLTRSRCF